MENRFFDEVTKSMAEGVPRRQAMRRVLGVVLGAVTGILGLSQGALAGSVKSVCNQFCVTHFNNSHDVNVCKTICQQCPSVTMLCGSNNRIDTLTCCTSGKCCGGNCTDLTSDQNNCGGCGVVCPGVTHCINGVCSCPFGSSPCYNPTTGVGYCANLTSDSNNCGGCGVVCGAGTVCLNGACVLNCTAPKGTLCNGGCVDVSTDPLNCGACGVICDKVSSCFNGTCQPQCPPQTVDCAGACVNLAGDPNNCGACGNACAANEACSNGQCGPACPTQICNGVCTDTTSDPLNCGVCGNACAPPINGSPTCVNSACGVVCNAGFVNCNGSCTNTSTDTHNCGACFNVCSPPNGVSGCANGVCVVVACNAGFGNCNGNPADGCETNLATDRNNCGACGNVCQFFQNCQGGACV